MLIPTMEGRRVRGLIEPASKRPKSFARFGDAEVQISEDQVAESEVREARRAQIALAKSARLAEAIDASLSRLVLPKHRADERVPVTV